MRIFHFYCQPSTASVLFFPTLEWVRTLVLNAFPEEESLNEVGGSETKIEVKTFLMEKNPSLVALPVSSKAAGAGCTD